MSYLEKNEMLFGLKEGLLKNFYEYVGLPHTT
jgi:hypothetical protein